MSLMTKTIRHGLLRGLDIATSPDPTRFLRQRQKMLDMEDPMDVAWTAVKASLISSTNSCKPKTEKQ